MVAKVAFCWIQKILDFILSGAGKELTKGAIVALVASEIHPLEFLIFR